MSKITLCYGPIEIQGVVRYRPLRMKKLICQLSTLGFNVTTERIQPRDRLVIKLDKIPIFTCRFTYLRFFYNNDDNYIVEKIIFSALEARERLCWGCKYKFNIHEISSI